MKIKVLMLTVLIIFIAANVFSQEHPPTDKMFDKTFFIQSDTLCGTCFALNYKNQEYIVTAKHLFRKNTKNKTDVKIKIYFDRDPKNITAKVFFHKDKNVDIAILKIPFKTSNEESYWPGGQIAIGQDVYFFGFPILKNKLYYSDDQVGRPLPLVKKAIVSGFVNVKPSMIVLLDGHNNPGFSGAPVMYYNYFEKIYMISSIVTGYYLQENQIKLDSNKSVSFDENSGIIKCYDIKNAKEIIDDISD
jgi:Trypsin-like peptidase domain